VDGGVTEKGLSLLKFLKDSAALRRVRLVDYTADDRVIWLCNLPQDCDALRSPFLPHNLDDDSEFWLEVRKKPKPRRPALPEGLRSWVRSEDLDQVDREPDLLSETLLDAAGVSDFAEGNSGDGLKAGVSAELERIEDHPELEEQWLHYLVDDWEPWARRIRDWQAAQTIYEDVDYMRRRLEESAEEYEVVLAAGLLQWIDPNQVSVKRHIVTGRAEVTLDAVRGMLTVCPAASFERFQVELDMLDPQHRPAVEGDDMDACLQELDIKAWDAASVAPILRLVGNRLSASTQIDEASMSPAARASDTPILTYAPAIVLRRRRPLAFDEVIDRLALAGDALEPTEPWRRLLLEGESSDGAIGHEQGLVDGQEAGRCVARYLLPLPANDEQRRIVDQLQASACVLVKGPPGTGKSHTIANLICHLLASGERILVTAQAPKALAVLRSLLPPEVRDLCVTTLGSSYEDRRQLEESVSRILQRRDTLSGPLFGNTAAGEAEQHLNDVQDALARVGRKLRTWREAETHSHTLQGGYRGTAAQIARALLGDRDRCGWFPDADLRDLRAAAGEASSDSHDDTSDLPREEPFDVPFPLTPAEVAFLATVHGEMSADRARELDLSIGSIQILEPDAFERLVLTLQELEQEFRSAIAVAESAKVEPLGRQSDKTVVGLLDFLTRLDAQAARSERVLSPLVSDVLADLLSGAGDRWSQLLSQLNSLVAGASRYVDQLGGCHVEIAPGVRHDKLRADADSRRGHFVNGGHSGFLFFGARVEKQTRYVRKACTVDGVPAMSPERLAKVVAHLDLETVLGEFQRSWPKELPSSADTRRGYERAAILTTELSVLVESVRAGLLSVEPVPPGERSSLADPGIRVAWRRACLAVIAERRSRHLQSTLNAQQDALEACQIGEDCHPCIQDLLEAAKARDSAGWRVAWEKRESLRVSKQRLAELRALLHRLDSAWAGLGAQLATCMGDPAWFARLSTLEQAWAWATSWAWLREFTDPGAYRSLCTQRAELTERARSATSRLVEIRAWQHFFGRLDQTTVQYLIAWEKAMRRTGRNTGKYAYRHRRAARGYLDKCVAKIPAWIMPLYRLWETVDARPGMFDTIIVDEASQAGTDALVLLLLAKRIIVVGDDRQNSPEAVGVREDDIRGLGRRYLEKFRFAAEYRPDASLYDHSERAFGVPLSLREHFRCVPEIIRFSNEMFYQDAPLIPLRQPPVDRLRPLAACFVGAGDCEGRDSRLVNRAEAKAVADTLEALLARDEYKDKTFGVIALQGHAQAQLIERMIAEHLDTKTIAAHRLRCGEPASFQGDERDVILLSMVVAPNVHYRALTGESDNRRYNVAMSRARDQMWLFHSVAIEELSPEDLRHATLQFFTSPESALRGPMPQDLDSLERAAAGLRPPDGQPEPYESWFEVDVALQLLRRHFQVIPQFGVAGYRIDLVVQGIDRRLAIECDGDAWHDAERYDHDMARQLQLERTGWEFVRIRASEFYADRDGAVRTVVNACEKRGIHPFLSSATAATAYVQEASSILTMEPAQVDVAATDTMPGRNIPAAPADVSAETETETRPPSIAHQLPECPDPRVSSRHQVAEALCKIILSEGPMKRSAACQLYVQACPALQRAGRSVQQELDAAMDMLVRRKSVEQREELGAGVPEGQVVRIAGTPPVVVRESGARDLLDIPPAELAAVLDHTYPGWHASSCDQETVLRMVLDHYGYRRLTKQRRSYLLRVLSYYRRQIAGQTTPRAGHPPAPGDGSGR